MQTVFDLVATEHVLTGVVMKRLQVKTRASIERVQQVLGGIEKTPIDAGRRKTNVPVSEDRRK